MGHRVDRKKQQDSAIVLKEHKYRIFILTVTIIFIVFILIGRLAYIQIIKGNTYYMMAESQWIKEIPIGVERGKIYDRRMIPLTNKKRYHYLVVFPELFSATEKNLEIIQEITGISKYDLKHNKLIGTRPIHLKVVNSIPGVLRKVVGIRGIFPIQRSERYDTCGLAAHLIGYINKIDNRGEKGLEKQYDKLLKENRINKTGAIVDAQKRMIPGLGYKILKKSSSNKNYNLVTTLDSQIQKIVEEEFDAVGQKGSVIVIDGRNGDILAMASRPNFDQNNVAAYLESNNKELFNRAVQITYPPGSIFKLVVAAAALESELVTPQDVFYCKGYEEIDAVVIKCNSFEKGGHGELNLEEAFAVSCNSVFIQLGQRISGVKIIEMAQKFGLGSLTGIELPEEVPGQLATEDYMKGAGIGNIAIGQGMLEVTPIQIAKMTSIIANDGIDKGVQLVKKIIDDNGTTIIANDQNKETRVISYNTARNLKKMMEKVVSEGTAKCINLEELGGAAGKTGSAEAVIDGQEAVHAWFTGYFPKNDPQYIITIIVEEGGSGGKVAAPLFSNIASRINYLAKLNRTK